MVPCRRAQGRDGVYVPPPRDEHLCASSNGGRPSKLTPDLIDALARAVKTGKNRENAAKSAGISPDTFAVSLT
ncbi:hypothetical protein [Streptomyces sp. NPDC014623]|uniref:hypothetical protein n=1 Tax=Streptomyces sp. NPDC014623 TaxID=3364875 RepID=UPI0036F4B790